jgi:PAS domain S-box-containing protein
MTVPNVPRDESGRLAALRAYNVLDSPPEAGFDDLAGLAAHACDASIALITFIDAERQWFKSRLGLSLQQTPRALSFGGHTILSSDVLVVPDATADDRFAGNFLVAGDSHVRFYAGAPLLTPDGHAIGALEVMDHEPRQMLPPQEQALRALARQVIAQLELRQQRRQLVDSQAQLVNAFQNAPVALAINRWSDRTFVDINPAFANLVGWSREEVKGRTSDELRLLDPDVVGPIRSRLAAQHGLHDTEVSIHTRLGEVRHVLAGTSLVELGGEPHAVTTLVDVTERKRAEEAEREQRTRLAAIIEHEPECVKLVDRSGRLLEMNPAGLAMLEVGSLAEAQEQDLIEYLLPQYRPAFGELHQRVLMGETATLEFEIQGKRGTRRWLETHAGPLRDATGEVQALLGITREITTRKQDEARIQQLNRVYVVLSEINEAIVRERNQHGVLTAACRIAVERGQFRMAWIGLLDDRDAQLRIAAHAGATEDTLQIVEALVAADDCAFTMHALHTGRHGVCNDIASDPRAETWRDAALARDYRAMASLPLKAGARVIGTFNLYSDIPEFFNQDEQRLLDELAADISFALEIHEREVARQRVDLALRESEERFRQLAENIQEVFWMTDPAMSEMLYISPQYERIWERSTASVYHAPEAWIDAVHPDDRARVTEAVGVLRSRGEFDETYRIVQPNGTVRWIRDRAYPVRSTDGTIVRLVGTAEDITERRELEEQFRQAQKMEAFGQLAGGVAHDFNNVLTVIRGYGSMLTMSPETSPETRDAAREIVEASERAANLTRQLLAFSRRQIMQPRLVNVNEIVTAFSRMLQRILGEDIELLLNLHPEPLTAHADPGMLDQMLMTLVVNARDAMRDGGRLTIETSVRVVADDDLRGTPGVKAGRYVVLTISDTGVGVAKEHLPRLFEPFFTTKKLGKGTGLGLATVFGIVSQHRGSIQVESELGSGTTVRVCLPLLDEDAASIEEDDDGVTLGGSETILVVEDESSVRALTRTVLERAGYQVYEAAHGREALRVWDEHRGSIQLLLTDIVMPEGLNGRELAARLQASSPGLKVVFTSGYSVDIAGRELTLEIGQNFIQKPSSPEHLLRTVRRCLDS